MPATETRTGIPYPLADDTVDVPRDVKAVADKLETDMAIDVQGTIAARPAAGKRGRYYFATDQGVVYRDDGTAWAAIGPKPQALSNGIVTGPTYSQTGSILSTVTMTTRGLGPVLATLSASVQNNGTHGTYFWHQLVVNRKIAGAVQDYRYGSGFGTNANGTNVNGSFTGVWKNLAAGTYDFELAVQTGSAGTLGLYSWEFSVLELV